MTGTRRNIDWQEVKQRLSHCQSATSDRRTTDGRISEVFRRRARQLAQRGRRDARGTARTMILAFRLGNERYGMELNQIQQVFARVAVTPVPGGAEHLLGVAGLNGTLRSVIDLGRFVNLPPSGTDGGCIVLVRAGGKLLGVWVKALEDVCHIDLDNLLPASDTAASATALIRGITDEGIIVLDAEALVRHVASRGVPLAGQPPDALGKRGSTDSVLQNRSAPLPGQTEGQNT